MLATGLGWLLLLDLSRARPCRQPLPRALPPGPPLARRCSTLSVLLFLRRPLSRGFAWLLSVAGEARAAARAAAIGRCRRRRRARRWRRGAAVLAFGLALANLRQLTSELGRVWLIVGAAWFFFLRAGPLTERLARSGTAGDLVPGATPGRCCSSSRCWSRAMLRHARHGPAPDRRLRARARSSPRRWRCGGTSAAAQRCRRVRARGRACSPAGSARVTSALFALGSVDGVTASRLESVAAPFASINDQLALVSWFQRADAGRGLRHRRRAVVRLRAVAAAAAACRRRSTATTPSPRSSACSAPLAAWAAALGCALWLHRLIRHHGRVTRGEPRLVGAGGQLGNDGQALLSWIAVAWVVLTLVPARRHGRRQPGGAAAHRRHLSVRQLRHDVAAGQPRRSWRSASTSTCRRGGRDG